MRILLIEDDRATGDWIAKGLREDGHVVDLARDGREGLFLALNEPFDVIVTDRMLPGPDGLAILRALRASGVATPVLMLTALGEVDRRVEGLEAGADDYLGKPFAFAELRARVRALGRRPLGPGEPKPVELRLGDLRMDLLARTVTRGQRRIELLPTEWRLLETMLRHPREVLTRTMLLEKVWDFAFDPTTNVVDVHVSRLRRKLEAPGEPPVLRTVRGAGYALDPPEPDAPPPDAAGLEAGVGDATNMDAPERSAPAAARARHDRPASPAISAHEPGSPAAPDRPSPRRPGTDPP